MNIKFLLLLVVTVALLAEVSSSCLCGAKGIDKCSCRGHIVRPYPLIRYDPKPARTVCSVVGGAQNYQPIGDICSCGGSIVKPALNPKTCIKCNKISKIMDQTPSCHDTVRAPEEFQGMSIDGANVYASAYQQYKPSVPADPVSMSLAYNMAKRASISVPEEKLQYGFRSIPKEQPHIKHYRDIPEERLWSSDRAVIELKPLKRHEEEDENEEIIEEEEHEQPSHLSHISYHELGYGSTKPQNCDFIVQREEYQPQTCQDEAPEIGDCGFQPGNLIQQEEQDTYDYQDQRDDDYREDDYQEDFYDDNEPQHKHGLGCGCSPILSKLFKNYNN